MKSSNPSKAHRPFKDLKSLLEKRSFPLASRREDRAAADPGENKGSEAVNEELLFQEAMSGVVPVAQDRELSDERQKGPRRVPEQDPEAEALARLEDLVRHGDGFVISDTPEYMEGIGYGVNPEVANRLHRGDFSIQGHLDLHGFVVEDAKEVFEQFLSDAILLGKRAVLIVHGRGLSSRAEPVLKTKVKEWLTSGPWRKWVLAFTSARACDGGAGATYVLLRQRPATKRERKGRKK
jgi:DNA-nicking Smr family endonuclease